MTHKLTLHNLVGWWRELSVFWIVERNRMNGQRWTACCRCVVDSKIVFGISRILITWCNLKRSSRILGRKMWNGQETVKKRSYSEKFKFWRFDGNGTAKNTISECLGGILNCRKWVCNVWRISKEFLVHCGLGKIRVLLHLLCNVEIPSSHRCLHTSPTISLAQSSSLPHHAKRQIQTLSFSCSETTVCAARTFSSRTLWRSWF